MAEVDTEYMGMSTERRRAIESGDMKAARRISAAMKAYATKIILLKKLYVQAIVPLYKLWQKETIKAA